MEAIHIDSQCQFESPFAIHMTVQRPATRTTHREMWGLHCRAASLMKSRARARASSKRTPMGQLKPQRRRDVCSASAYAQAMRPSDVMS